MKHHQADIILIQKWLDKANIDISLSNEKGELDESKWPDVIKNLSPQQVIIKRTKPGEKYVRLMWGSGMLGSYGLVVGISSEGIPLNEEYVSEYRLVLDLNAFVWGELKRP